MGHKLRSIRRLSGKCMKIHLTVRWESACKFVTNRSSSPNEPTNRVLLKNICIGSFVKRSLTIPFGSWLGASNVKRFSCGISTDKGSVTPNAETTFTIRHAQNQGGFVNLGV